jgi:hypothetical protein
MSQKRKNRGRKVKKTPKKANITKRFEKARMEQQ